jgi:hypothetical protein
MTPLAQAEEESIGSLRAQAERGEAWAQLSLGNIYSLGLGVPENVAEALRWYRLAAEQGNASAQVRLGNIYDHGLGVPENVAEALRWYRLAADQGDASGQNNLGGKYARGDGVPENYVEAYKWFSLSASLGNKIAAGNRDHIRLKMTTSQIAEAQRLAAAWKPSVSGSNATQGTEAEEAVPTVGSGTGFYVTAAGHLVTNAHVVEGCARVTLADGSRLSVLDVDEGADLALLRNLAASATTPLMLRQGRGVRLAESIIVAGYPLAGLLSSGLNVTTGSVSALAGLGDDRRQLQITAPVQPGNSGGPVLDQSGNIVGVVVSKLDALAVASVIGDIPQNVNFAVSLGTLQALLDENAVEYQTRASSVPSSNADVAELAKSATVQVLCSS